MQESRGGLEGPIDSSRGLSRPSRCQRGFNRETVAHTARAPSRGLAAAPAPCRRRPAENHAEARPAAAALRAQAPSSPAPDQQALENSSSSLRHDPAGFWNVCTTLAATWRRPAAPARTRPGGGVLRMFACAALEERNVPHPTSFVLPASRLAQPPARAADACSPGRSRPAPPPPPARPSPSGLHASTCHPASRGSPVAAAAAVSDAPASRPSKLKGWAAEGARWAAPAAASAAAIAALLPRAAAASSPRDGKAYASWGSGSLQDDGGEKLE